MPHYPVLKPREIISALSKKGYKFKRQRGSHAIYSDGHHNVTIPMHDTVDTFTLKSILQTVEIELDEFLKLL
ncbi:MAG: type II toxin-antitoxin system HicA family toxin [Candidatus Cloacimonetes bacterium]|nr:type II toxin-antitoxin system HicA family toxin [Candidatus Cloacimonadota bacterium]